MVTEVPNASRQVFFQEELEARFGTISLGQKGFLEIRIQNTDGRLGEVATTSQDFSTS